MNLAANIYNAKDQNLSGLLASLTTNESDFDMANIPDTKLIPLTQGKFAIVDAENYDFLMQWKWYFHKRYARRTECLSNGKQKRIMMHRLIMSVPDNMITDHINNDGLDNRRHNLRACTNYQNSLNRKSNINGTSKYKGVSWEKQNGKWKVQIRVDGIKKYLGYFISETEAAIVYNNAALKYHGEFARLNQIEFKGD